jgi:hypothetical protein
VVKIGTGCVGTHPFLKKFGEFHRFLSALDTLDHNNLDVMRN